MAVSINNTIVVHDDRTLVNVSNFKTVNSASVLGSGNITLTNLKLLGTMTTTSGTVQSLSGLTLTNFKYLIFVYRGVSHTGAANREIFLGSNTVNDLAVTQAYAATSFLYGMSFVGLTSNLANTGITSTNAITTTVNGSGVSNSTRGTEVNILTTNTTISVALSGAGNFDAGSITVYGVR